MKGRLFVARCLVGNKLFQNSFDRRKRAGQVRSVRGAAAIPS